MSLCLDFRINYFSGPFASVHISLRHFSWQASRQALHWSPRWQLGQPDLSLPSSNQSAYSSQHIVEHNATTSSLLSITWNGNDATHQHHPANKVKHILHSFSIGPLERGCAHQLYWQGGGVYWYALWAGDVFRNINMKRLSATKTRGRVWILFLAQWRKKHQLKHTGDVFWK